ncbi:MAG TPA: transketolase C-terminal domain-containing protein [Cytophagaceae bacterium]|jgi:transketolase|nr:transketolase C-terminal domain-containing protein [Cytophagaceae bacterium]
MNYEKLITEIALQDERYIIMTAENRALIKNIPQNSELKKRFVDTGITEQCMIGMAAGFALRGRIPIVHALAAFLTMRAYEFIRTDVGIGALPVKLSGFIPGFLSDGNGPTHQAIEDVAIMRGIPGMQVFCPADEEDMLLALPTIWSSPSPSYLRVNLVKPIISHDKNFTIGKAEVISEGKDITFLVYGMLFSNVYKAKEILEQKGYSVGLVNMRSLKPVDEEVIKQVAKNSELIVAVEDHFQTGGLYSILAEVLLKNRITSNVHSLSLKEKWFRPGRLNDVLEYEGFTPEKIAAKALNAFALKEIEVSPLS